MLRELALTPFGKGRLLVAALAAGFLVETYRVWACNPTPATKNSGTCTLAQANLNKGLGGDGGFGDGDLIGGGGCGGGCPTLGPAPVEPAGLGVPRLTLDSTAVRVKDTPMWFDESVGPSFVFEMLYDSLDDRSRTNLSWRVGYRWQLCYANYIEVVGSARHFHVGGGRYYKFVPDAQGGYKEEHGPGVNAKGGTYFLEQSGTNLLIHVRGGGRYEFQADGAGVRYRLIAVQDKVGKELAVNYAPSGLMTSIVTAAGNVFEFAYSGSGRLTNVHDVTGNRNAVLVYTNDLLAQVTDMGGQTFKYGYDGQGRLTSLARPNLTGYDTTSIAYSGSPAGGLYEVTITYPAGNTEKNRWGGYTTSTMDVYDGLGGVTKQLPDRSYSWGEPYVEETDPLGRVTTTIYWDNTGNAAINGKVKKRVDPDGTVTEYLYSQYGDTISTVRKDADLHVVSVTTNSYTYFSGTWAAASVLTEAKDGAGALLAKSLKNYSRHDRGTTNVWDDVFLLVSEKRWIDGGNYSETRYTHNTNFLIVTRQELTGPGTNDFRVVQTRTYDGLKRVVQLADALANVVHYSYDIVNRLSAVTNAAGGVNRVGTYSYDGLNRLTHMVHPDGVSESWTHAPCGCGILSHTDRGGNVTAHSYDANKRLKKKTTTTTSGTVVAYAQFRYNAVDSVTNTWDALTNRQVSVYNTAGDLVQRIDPLGRVTQYAYDSKGRQYRTTYPDGTYSENTYDAASRVIAVARYAAGGGGALSTEQYTYDGLGRRVTATDPVGSVTSNAFDLAGRITQVSYDDGSFSQTEYDLLGNALKQIGPVPAGATQQQKDDATTQSAYDALDRLISVTDSENRVTRYEYDPGWPRQTRHVRNDNNQVVQENRYQPLTGRLATNIAYGVTTAYEYNALGNVTKTVFPDGSFARNTYDGPRLVSQTSRTGNTTSFAYDAAGRRTAVTNSLGHVTRYTLDAAGNVTKVTDALNNTTAFAYDALSRLTVTTLADGRASTNGYDALGRLVARTGAGSVPVSYEYDALGRMTKLIDGEKNQTAFEYDSLGRLVKKTYADGSFYQYAYNARGWLTLRTDPKGSPTAYEYSNAGELTKVDYLTDADILYGLDNLGRMTSRVDAAGTWSFTYDGQSSRVLSESLHSGGGTTSVSSVCYAYAAATYDLASVSLGACTTLYSWAAGRLTNVAWQAGTDRRAVRYSCLANSDLLHTTTYLNGTVTVTRAYDILDRLVAVTNDFGSGGAAFNYTLDSTGRRTARSDSEKVCGLWSAVCGLSWGYDGYDQLTSAGKTAPANPAPAAAYDFAYQYDEVGNRLHEDRGQLDLDGTFNPLNQLTHRDWSGKLDVYGKITSTNPPVANFVNGVASTLFTAVSPTQFLGVAALQAGSNIISIVTADGSGTNETLRTVYMPPVKPQAFCYDLNGNLTNDGQRVYTWNEENRLVAIEALEPAVPAVSRRRSEYVYDAQWRRVQSTDYSGWNGLAYAATNVTRYVWDGWLLLAELTSSNTVSAFNVWGLDLSGTLQGAGGIGGLLGLARGPPGEVQFCAFDGNGNLTHLISINGEAIAHYEYDPFGRLVSSSGPQAAQNPWRFSTKQIEPQWSLYYYGYRYYSQNLGRWTSRDPIGDIDDSGAQAASPYLFVVNSPISKVDALGMQAMAVRIANISPGRCGGWGATTEHTASGTGYWVHRFYVKVPRRGVRRILAWQRCGCEEWTGPAVEEWFYEVFPAVNGEIVKDSSNEDRWSNCTMSLESGFKQKIAVFLPDTNAATDPHPAPFGPNVSARSRHAAKSLPPGWDQRIRNRIGAGLYWKVEFSWSWNCMDGRFDSETQVTGSASSGMPGARTPQK